MEDWKNEQRGVLFPILEAKRGKEEEIKSEEKIEEIKSEKSQKWVIRVLRKVFSEGFFGSEYNKRRARERTLCLLLGITPKSSIFEILEAGDSAVVEGDVAWALYEEGLIYKPIKK